MSHIGNTFSHAFLDIFSFLVVLFSMLLAFAVVFNLVFSMTNNQQFNSLGQSLFTLFRGLIGDVSVSTA